MKTFRCMANQGDDDDSIVKHKLATTAVRKCTSLTTGNVPAELKHILIYLKAEEREKVLMDLPDDGFVAYLLS
eukprot:Em0002g774a